MIFDQKLKMQMDKEINADKKYDWIVIGFRKNVLEFGSTLYQRKLYEIDRQKKRLWKRFPLATHMTFIARVPSTEELYKKWYEAITDEKVQQQTEEIKMESI